MTVVFNDWVTTDETSVELKFTKAADDTVTEAVEDMLTGGVDTKLGCTILVVYTT